MRLSRLYSNRPDVFVPIEFNRGLSAIVAEIRIPENRLLDTHNLGKTTVGQLLDFCLLKGKHRDFFLFRHPALFNNFVFYLEVELPQGGFLTIARPVHPGSRIDFAISDEPIRNVEAMDELEWVHTNVPFSRALLILDGILGLRALKPWGFRKIAGYLVRSQTDYLDVFQLGKFSGKHQDWKPFVSHLLGLDAEAVIALYNKREELAVSEEHLSSLTREWRGEDADPSVLDALISVKRRDVEAKSRALEEFSFRDEDAGRTTELVEDTEARIAALNEEGYRLSQLVARIDLSLADEQIFFDPAESEKLFREAGIAFGEQVTRTYRQLVAFNRAITFERREVLEEQRAESLRELERVNDSLTSLNEQRSRFLEFLRETDTLRKYKELSEEVTIVRADLLALEEKRNNVTRILELRREYRVLQEELGRLENHVESDIDRISRDDESTFGRFRRYFTEIVHEVLGQNAVLAVSMNGSGGIEFTAEFIGESGQATSADRGTSYKKLLCIAFDLALLRTRLDVPFPRFVFHDGAFEQLDPRKREKLLGVLREYAALGLQPIVSLLDSDLPAPLDSGPSSLSREDVVATLHDQGEDGRLFKMDSW